MEMMHESGGGRRLSGSGLVWSANYRRRDRPGAGSSSNQDGGRSSWLPGGYSSAVAAGANCELPIGTMGLSSFSSAMV